MRERVESWDILVSKTTPDAKIPAAQLGPDTKIPISARKSLCLRSRDLGHGAEISWWRSLGDPRDGHSRLLAPRQDNWEGLILWGDSLLADTSMEAVLEISFSL